MKRDRIKTLLDNKKEKQATIYGWIRTNRAQAQFGFLNINDGSTLTNLQVVYDNKLDNFEDVSKFRVGVSVMIEGAIILTPTMKQPLELHATKIIIYFFSWLFSVFTDGHIKENTIKYNRLTMLNNA